jgi:hypothetical protein
MQTANVLSSRSIRAAGPRVAPRRPPAHLVSPHVCRGVQFNEQFMGEHQGYILSWRSGHTQLSWAAWRQVAYNSHI